MMKSHCHPTLPALPSMLEMMAPCRIPLNRLPICAETANWWSSA
jgi:hypothetical protein